MRKKSKKAVSIVLIMVMILSALLPAKTYEVKAKDTYTVVIVGGTNRSVIAKAKKGTIYTYRSSNEKIAKVATNGVVTGVKKGKASVIRYATKKGKTKIDKVIQFKVEKFAIKGKKKMYVNGVYQLTTNGTKVKWKSSNKKIATITKKGKLKAKKAGKVTITATSGKIKVKKKFTIKKDGVKGFTAAYQGNTIYQNQKINATDFKVQSIYKSGVKKRVYDFKMNVDSFSKAGVNEITLTYKEYQKKIKLQIVEKKVTSIQANYVGNTLAVNQSVTVNDFQVTAVYNDGTIRMVDPSELALSNATATEKGTLPVVVTHTPSGVQTSVNVLVNGLSIMGVDTHYTEKVIYTDEGVDVSKVKIMVTYEDGSTGLVDASDIRIGSVETEDGQVKVVLYYTVNGVEYSTILSVEERSRKLIDLTVSSSYDYLYTERELNPSNFVVKAIYSDGTEKAVDNWVCDYLPTTEEGTQTVTFQYTEDDIIVSKSVEYQVKKVQPVEIRVQKYPATVKEGMALDLSQLEVALVYDDGSKETVSGCQVNYDQNNTAVGARTVEVVYQAFKTSFTLQVIGKKVVKLHVTNPTMNTIAGGNLNTTGMTVTAEYDNGTKSVVNGWTTNYSAQLPAGNHTLVVYYAGAEATFSLVIAAPLTVHQSASSDIVKHPIVISSNHGDVTYSLAAGDARLSGSTGNSCTVVPLSEGTVVVNITRKITGEVKQVSMKASNYKMTYLNANGGNVALGDKLVYTANAATQFTYKLEADSGVTYTGTATPSNNQFTHTPRNTGMLTVTAKDLISGELFTKTVRVYKALAISGASSVKVHDKITLSTTKQQVIWSTSNDSIASISTKGVVKGKTKGTVTITATFPEYANRTVTKKITVKE